MIGVKKTHEEYVKDVSIKNPKVDVIGTYVNNETSIYHKCKMCGWEWLAKPHNILNGKSCPICAYPPQLIGPPPQYKNSIWDSKYKNLAQHYGLSEIQMKTIMPKSNKKIEVKCPNCGYTKLIVVSDLFSQGFGCNKCSDGISYPEKFFISLLTQLNINYKTHISFSWSANKQYDFYLPDYECIIEVHGEQHFRNTGRGRTLDEEQANDTLKEKLAKENGIQYYFQIDCRKSEIEWIRDHIVLADMPYMLNFTLNDIDWYQCNFEALSSMVKRTADLWNKGYSVKHIANEFNVDRHSVRRWLYKAKEANLCDYSSQDSWNRGHDNEWVDNLRLFNKNKSKQIICIETQVIYVSQNEAGRKMNIPQGNIGRSVRSNGKYAVNGYHFKAVYNN